IALPLYIYPTPSAWSPLYNAIAANPQTSFNVIINPSNGPGSPAPDENYISALNLLNNHTNVDVYGYVHLSWGDRSLDALDSDIRDYGTWTTHNSNFGIRLDGVFLDEAPTDISYVSYTAAVASSVKSSLGRDAKVWSNPGTPVDPAFYGCGVDLVNAFEDSWDAWNELGGV
ncbi:Spherulation-specific family 4, partial [Delphinella strobiligena]